MVLPKKWRSNRHFADQDDMWQAFVEYAEDCDNHRQKRTAFSPVSGHHVTDEISTPVTCSINGFCVHAGITKDAFYNTYVNDPAFADVVSNIKSVCEEDARRKFEDGSIPQHLAALWMGAYGYSTKQEQDIKGGVPVVITGEGDLKD